MTVLPLHGDKLPWTPQAEADAPETAKKDDERFWSVTTIIANIGDSGGLTGWTANRVANSAIDNESVWRAMLARGQHDEAVKYLAGSRFQPRPGHSMTDREIGSAFHALAEQWIYDGARPTVEVGNAKDRHAINQLLDNFGKWLDIAQPVFEALEMTVYNPALHYAGTLDGICVVNGIRAVIDYKTSLDHDEPKKRKGPWATTALQLAAYRHASFVAVWKARRYEKFSRRYYLLNDSERALAVRMPAVDTGIVLHVTPDHADTYIVDTGFKTFEGFLAAVDATAWLELEADNVFIDTTMLNTNNK
jgi:hypothetical protein